MAEVEERPQEPVLCTDRPGAMYAGRYYENSAIALAAYTADDRQWLLKLARQQRAYMEHMTTCPKRFHQFEKSIRCECGMSDYFVEVLT